MTYFHNDAKHSNMFALLYASHDNIEEKFKAKTENFPYVVIKDKEEKRISAMLSSAGEIGRQFVNLQLSAIQNIAVAHSYDEAMLIQAGLLPLMPSGVGICPTCLAKTILLCEEQLIILKDIQEAIKSYTNIK